MNLFQLQEQLKNFSQDQLVNEMRNPTGTAPQYLVLSELQRRRRIMQEEQAQMPQQASVAEEAVAAAGMPQGGLAQMAQAMAPETDVVQNTARMFGGGNVGARGGEPDRSSISLPQGTTGQDIVDFISRDPQAVLQAGTSSAADPISGILGFIQSGLSEGASQQGGPSQQELAAQMNTGTTDSRMAALEQYKTLYGRPIQPVRGMAEGGKIRRDVYERNRPRDEGEDDFRGIYMTPLSSQEDFRGFAYTERMAAPERERDPFVFMADDPFGRSMRNARAAMRTRADESYEADLRDALSAIGSDYEGMGARERSLREEDDDMRDMIESLMRSQSETVGGFAGGGMIDRRIESMIADRYDEDVNRSERRADELYENARREDREYGSGFLGRILQNLADRDDRQNRRIANLLADPQGRNKIDREMADFMRSHSQTVGGFAEGGVVRMQPGGLTSVSTNLNDFGVDEFGGLPSYMTDPTAPRTGRPQLMLDDTRRLLEEDQDLSDAERRALEARIATMEAIGEGGGIAGDIVQGIDDAVADAYALTGRVAGAGIEGLGLGASAILGPEVGAPILEFGESVRTSMDPIAEEGFIPGVVGDRQEDEEPTRPVQEDFTFGNAPVGSLPAEPRLTFGANLTAREEDLAPITTDLSFGNLEAQREGTSAPATGGAAAPTGPSSDDLFEQDKWLALAQFGLGLMSSQAPTFGQAIGEAGLTGIAALRQAQEDRQDRITAAQARADRLAAAAARASDDEAEYPYRQVDDFIELAKLFQARADSIKEANFGEAPQPGEPLYEDYIDALSRASAAINRSARMADSE